MPFAAALSEHPVTSQATGEVVGAVLEALGERPDFAVLTATPPHLGALDDVAATVDSILEPAALLGCAAESVVSTGREVEESPALSLWAGRVGPVVPFELHARSGAVPGEPAFDGWPDAPPFSPTAAVVVADPFSIDAQALLDELTERQPGIQVVGGNASAGRGRGGSRLVFGGRVLREGAVGVLIGGNLEATALLSQGSRPYGSPLTVTRAERNVVYEIAGDPAMERMVGQIRGALVPEEVTALETGGLHLGVVVADTGEAPGPEDFVVRSVLGADRSNGAIAVDGEVPVGATVQFHYRSEEAADADLRHALASLARRTRPRPSTTGALLFTCTGRGTRLFDGPDHDAGAVGDLLGRVPLGGFFAAGEFGAVGGHSFVHGFSASLLVLSEPDDSPAGATAAPPETGS